MMSWTRDAEAELNLPPGFRFHPTDQELVVHYLCRRAAHQPLPVPIIAELNLYEHDPWQLPDKALFGNREWYFFTPRDRKYPKGSRPNRTAGSGYWKATGTDKPVASAGCARPLGIKKALVFYAGKSPNGVKTDWIMHEYRLADANRAPNKKGGSNLRMDDWVLCRLYNKNNNWVKAQRLQAVETTTEEAAVNDTCSDSFRTPESDVDNDVHTGLGSHGNHFGVPPPQIPNAQQAPDGASIAAGSAEGAGRTKQEDENWLGDLDLDGLGSSPVAFGVAPTMDLSYQEYLAALASPQLRPGHDMLRPFRLLSGEA